MKLFKEVLWKINVESKSSLRVVVANISFVIVVLCIVALPVIFICTRQDTLKQNQECGVVKLRAYSPRPNTKLRDCIGASYNEPEQLLSIQKCCEK